MNSNAPGQVVLDVFDLFDFDAFRMSEDDKIWLVGLITGVRPPLTPEEIEFQDEVLPGQRGPVGDREEAWLHLANLHARTWSDLREGRMRPHSAEAVFSEFERTRRDAIQFGEKSDFDALEPLRNRLDQVFRFVLARERWKKLPQDLRYPKLPGDPPHAACLVWGSYPESSRREMSTGMANEGEALRTRWKGVRLARGFLRAMEYDDLARFDPTYRHIARMLKDALRSRSSKSDVPTAWEAPRSQVRLTVLDVLDEIFDPSWDRLKTDGVPAIRTTWLDLLEQMQEGDQLWLHDDHPYSEFVLKRNGKRIASVMHEHQF